MILKHDSVNITPKDLITNAVRVLQDAESARYSNDTANMLTRVAQGYLRAAELMQYNDTDYIDLVKRPNYG